MIHLYRKAMSSRWAVWLGIVPMFFFPYIIINHMPMHREIISLTQFDRFMPFWPWTFVVYVSLFAQYIMVAERLPMKLSAKLIIAFAALAAVSFGLFFIFPIQFPRELYSSSSPIISFFRLIDGPGNCFPSLHVSLTIFLGYCYSSVEKSMAKVSLMWLWTLLVILSVLTTKQHYFIDILGAVALVVPVILVFRNAIAPSETHWQD